MNCFKNKKLVLIFSSLIIFFFSNAYCMEEQHHVAVFVLKKTKGGAWVLLKSCDNGFDTFRTKRPDTSDTSNMFAKILLWNEGVRNVEESYFFASLDWRREYSNVSVALNYKIFFVLMDPRDCKITIDLSKGLQWVDINSLLNGKIQLHNSLSSLIYGNKIVVLKFLQRLLGEKKPIIPESVEWDLIIEKWGDLV